MRENGVKVVLPSFFGKSDIITGMPKNAKKALSYLKALRYSDIIKYAG